MELDLANRVAARVGSSRSLELNKLSNLMAHAGLVHTTVPRAPAAPARLSRVEQHIAIITHEQKLALRDVFCRYAAWGARHSYMHMSCSQFLRFCHDANLMSQKLDAVALSLLFDKVGRLTVCPKRT
jgi:hypothetical protein